MHKQPKKPTVKSLLRENWYFPVLIIVCLLGAVVLAVRKEPEEQPAGTGADLGQTAAAAGTAADLAEPVKPAVTAADKARAAIDEHRRKIAENPERDDAPALLNAMGNLYMQKLGDYEQAVQCYERILIEYDDSNQKRTALINLANCYEKLGDRSGARYTYQRMLDTFPEDAQEYKFAQQKLR